MLTLIAVVAAAIALAVIANWKLQFFKWDLMDEVKKVAQSPEPGPGAPSQNNPQQASQPSESRPKRARSSRGRFVADDPNTRPINEAWVGGTAPEKKSTTTAPNRRGSSKK